MTVTELKEKLAEIEQYGHGEWPVKVLSGFTVGLDDPEPTEFTAVFSRKVVVL